MKMWVERIRSHLTPDLVKKEYRGHYHPMAGHCYVASEAAYHLFAKQIGYRPHQIKHMGVSHWFLQNESNKILDLTADQFQNDIPYQRAICRGFLTKEPSKRTQILMDRVLHDTR